MTTDDIREYLDWYEKNFEYIFNHFEGYKWKAIKSFQDEKKKHKGSPSDYLYEATKSSSNLLDNRYAFPRGMMKDFFDYNHLHPDVTNSALDAFNRLLENNDKTGIDIRIETFVKSCRKALKEYWPDNSKRNTFQDVHAASIYLSFEYPETFYIYRLGEFKTFNEQVLNNEFTISRDSAKNYSEYIRMCDQIRSILKSELEESISFANALNRIKADDQNYADPALNLLTQDFIYSVVKYYPNDFTKHSSRKAPKIVLSEELDVSAFSNNSTSAVYQDGDKSPQRTDYVAKQKANSRIGKEGERWVKEKYEPERLKKAGVKISNSKIQWVSRISDAYGFDIQSFDTDGQPIYIEVKTTNGPLESEFYISDYELDASRRLGNRYRLYRVYDYGKEPKVQVIKGCLDNLVPVARTFSIKLNKIKK